MKKILKKGLLALTLMLGMAFAAPQQALADDTATTTKTVWPNGNYTTYTYAGNNIVMIRDYTRDGKLLRVQYRRMITDEPKTLKQ